MLDFILLRIIIFFSFQQYRYFLIGPEIHAKLRVEQTKLQICQSQTESDINWKCYHYIRKRMDFLESKNTKSKTKTKKKKKKRIENCSIKGKKRY